MERKIKRVISARKCSRKQAIRLIAMSNSINK